jgi:hypothetical protein
MIPQRAAATSAKTHSRADTTAEPKAYKNTPAAGQTLRLPLVSRKTIRMIPSYKILMALMYMAIGGLAGAHELLRGSVRVKAPCLPFTIEAIC